MLWFVVMHLFSALLDLIRISRLSEHDKDLEILLLRQQLGIAERKVHKPVRASRVEPYGLKNPSASQLMTSLYALR